MNKALRLLGTGVLVAVAIRLLDLLLSPAIPLLVAIYLTGLVIYVAIFGRRSL